MGFNTGEIFALAGLKISSGDFAEYGALLKQTEGKIGDFSAASQAMTAGAFTLPAAAIAGVAAYGISVASSMQDASASLTTVYGDLDVAKEKFAWLSDFAASTPFEFPELLDATVKLKGYGIEAQEYMGTIGDASAAMGKSLDQTTEAVADAMTGEFERLKEYGIKATVITKANAQQLGADLADVGRTALSYTSKSGEDQIKVVDRTNKAMVLSSIQSIWDVEKGFKGAMETRSKTMSGMISTIKDNLSMGLADVVGFKDMEVQTFSLMGVLMLLTGVAVGVTGAFNDMGEPMQTLLVVVGAGVSAFGLIAAASVAYGMILPLITAETFLFGTALSAAIWPVTLAIGGFALLAAGMVYLNEKTGILSAAWEVLKDVFTITANYLSGAVTGLKNWISTEIDAIKTKFLEIIPEGAITGITNFYNTVTTYFGGAAQEISNKADAIKVKNGEMDVSFGNSGEAATLFGGMASFGYKTAETAATNTGSTVQASNTQMSNGFGVVGSSAILMGSNTKSATGQMVGGLTGAGSAAVGMGSDVAGAAGGVNTLTGSMQSGSSSAATFIGYLNSVSSSLANARSNATSAAAAMQAAGSSMEQAQKAYHSYMQSTKGGNALGATSKGGNGTGEGKVTIVSNTTKIGTINNNGDKLNTQKAKAAGV